MATAGFPIIGSPTVWSEWASFGSSSWNMWFMAPYGSWIYAGFVKSNTAYFRKINIGVSDSDYPLIPWEFGLAINTPATTFLNEQNEGYPNGSMGMGCIRGDTPTLYLGGRSSPAINVDDAIIHKFLVDSNFEKTGVGLIPKNQANTAVLSVNQICGIEVDPGNSVYIVTNNSLGQEFMLRRYEYTFAGALAATEEIPLSDAYLDNNPSARIRGIAISSVDGNILIFVNTGFSSTDCKVYKFHKTTLAYLGVATWLPGISTSTWAYVVRNSDVFMYFKGLDSTSASEQQNAVYYDRATAIPDETKSNFIIHDNLVTFGSNTPVELTYEAKDAFNIPVEGVPTLFYITGEDYDNSSVWTDRVASIQDDPGDTFFNPDDTPTATSVVVDTDVNGIATAYYLPMRTGTGTERDSMSVKCPYTTEGA